jgi:hypothetical protein
VGCWARLWIFAVRKKKDERQTIFVVRHNRTRGKDTYLPSVFPKTHGKGTLCRLKMHGKGFFHKFKILLRKLLNLSNDFGKTPDFYIDQLILSSAYRKQFEFKFDRRFSFKPNNLLLNSLKLLRRCFDL